ncbi:MAG: FAD-dependent oxidoreductase [Anaerolineaceae bacterium]
MESSDSTLYDILIIGGGPAGATAGIYTARAGLKVGILDKGLTTGALGTTSKIANYPGVNGEISGADLLKVMRKQAQGFGAEFINDKAIGSDLSSNPKVVFGNFGVYSARAIIIATGSMGRANLIKGEAELLGRGVSYCAVCDAAFFKGKDVAVIGKSDEAIEEALYLTRFVKTLHFFSPTEQVNVPAETLAELTEKVNVVMHPGSVVREICGEQKVECLRVSVRGSKEEESLPVEGVFVYLQGGKPITDFVAGQLEISEEGCLQVDRENQTAIPGVYAVGDVLCSHLKQAVIAASDGAVAAISAEKWLRGKARYRNDWAH